MFEILSEFFKWYWESRAGLIVTLIILTPIITWEIVKRMPQRRRRNVKRK